jgi:uncharacterized protein DUF3105
MVGASLLVLAALTFYLTRPRSGPPLTLSQRAILARAPAAAEAAGCTGVKSVGPYKPESEDRLHLSSSFPALSRYRTHPPVSGPHSGDTLHEGIYGKPPPIPEAIHSLEHGAVEVWYDPSASGEELSRIRSFFASSPENDHLIVAPYTYPAQGEAGQLPPGMTMALVAWHRIELCAQPSFPVAFAFVVRFRSPPPKGETYQGTAPEAGVGI